MDNVRRLSCLIFAAVWIAAGCGAGSSSPGSSGQGTGGNGSGGSSGGLGTGGDNGGSGGGNASGGSSGGVGTGGDSGGGPDAAGTGGDNGGAGPADGGIATGTSTGVPRDTVVNDLDPTQAATLCDWWNNKQGGYGQSAQCGDDTEADDADQDDCTGSLDDCGDATVADFEDCGNAIGTNLCMFRTNAACATLSACFTPDDGGDDPAM